MLCVIGERDEDYKGGEAGVNKYFHDVWYFSVRQNKGNSFLCI
jgi:hypothetical protein